MPTEIKNTDSHRRRASRFATLLGCTALLALSACSDARETVPDQTATDDQMVMQQNEKASTLMHLGNSLRAKGDLNGAAQIYHRAARADPGSPLPPAALGDTLRHLGRYQEAEEIYHQVLGAIIGKRRIKNKPMPPGRRYGFVGLVYSCPAACIKIVC